MALTRAQQRTDRIYHVVGGGPESWFVTPDGEGRFWYDSKAELLEAHPDMAGARVVGLLEEPADW